MKTSRIAVAAASLAALVVAAVLAFEPGHRSPEAPSAHASATDPASPGPHAVDQLFAAALTDPVGKPGGLSQYKGKVLVVNFWASWCGPCVHEMPTLAELSRRYGPRGVQFVGIGVDSQHNVASFLGKVHVDYPIFVSGFGGADLARALGNAAGGLPFTVVLDANGVVRLTKLGEITATELGRTLDAI